MEYGNSQSAIILERKVIDWSMANDDISSSEFLVLVVIARRCDQRSISCYPGVARLASDTKMSEATVRRALKTLKSMGLIEIKQRFKDGQQQSNVYTVSLSGIEGGCHDDTPTPVTVKGGGCHDDTPTPVTVTPRTGPSNGAIERNPFAESEPPKDEQEFSPREEEETVRIPWKKIESEWNSMAEECGLPMVVGISSQRKRSVRARVKKFGVDSVMTVINAPRRSKFLSGKAKTKDGSVFRPNIDWFIKESSFIKVLEGVYYDEDKPSDGNGKEHESQYAL